MLLIQLYSDASMWRNVTFTVGEVGEVFQLQTWTQAVLNNNDKNDMIKKKKTKHRTLEVSFHTRTVMKLNGPLVASLVQLEQLPPYIRLFLMLHLKNCIEYVITVYQHPCNSQTLYPLHHSPKKSSSLKMHRRNRYFCYSGLNYKYGTIHKHIFIEMDKCVVMLTLMQH